MYLPNKSRSLPGYTLIEILVVIVIIGLLTTMATASYNKAQMNARDNSRKTNVIALAHAVEQYYSVNKKLPGKQNTITDGVTDANFTNCEAADGNGNYFYRNAVTQETDASFNTASQSCNRKIMDGVTYAYNPADWSPFPVWIPGLGTYINPFPVESMTHDDTDPLAGSTQSYGYRHLINGYAVYSTLENTSDASTDKNLYKGSDSSVLQQNCSTLKTGTLTFGDTTKSYYVVCQ